MTTKSSPAFKFIINGEPPSKGGPAFSFIIDEKPPINGGSPNLGSSFASIGDLFDAITGSISGEQSCNCPSCRLNRLLDEAPEIGNQWNDFMRIIMDKGLLEDNSGDFLLPVSNLDKFKEEAKIFGLDDRLVDIITGQIPIIEVKLTQNATEALLNILDRIPQTGSPNDLDAFLRSHKKRGTLHTVYLADNKGGDIYSIKELLARKERLAPDYVAVLEKYADYDEPGIQEKPAE